MKELRLLARGFLEASGYRVVDQDAHCSVFDRLLFGQDRDTVLLWTAPEGQEISDYEAVLHAQIPNRRTNYPDAKAYVLAHSRGGFSRDMLQIFADNRVKFLVPIQFFDMPFRHEETGKVSVIADIRAQAHSERRVPQPFRVEQSTTGIQNEDVFAHLFNAIAFTQKPIVRLVVGRAGIGKSYLFRALFARLYDGFLDAKAKHDTWPRPVPLTPEHMRGTYALRTEALIDNFLRSDVAAPVTRETFEWLLVNGFSTWLLDGLDELYAGDQTFFDYILDLLTRPDSLADITILCRDSLITTSDAFAEFTDLCSGSNLFEVYSLADWDRKAKRLLAWFHFEDRYPQDGEPDSGKVLGFMTEVDRSQPVRTLSNLPFYCQTLLELFEASHKTEFGDDVALLDYVVDQTIKREVDKNLLDMRLFEDRGLEQWLELMAVTHIEEGRYTGITRDHASEYGQLVLRAGLDPETRNHLLTTLLQFPLFKAGSDTGLLTFTHDLIADSLGARAYLADLVKSPAETGRRLSHGDLQDPVILRFMAKRMGHAELTKVLDELRRGGLQDRVLAILLSLAMIACPDRDLLKRSGVDLESQDLAGISFKGRDLSGLSFRRSDLSHAAFEDCDLRSARFEGTYLGQTRFVGKNNLQGAMFGDLSRVESVWVGGRLIADPNKICEWIRAQTRSACVVAEPCPTALQVSYLFRKFVTPLGIPRRDQLDYRGLVAGKQIPGAAPTKECLTEVISGGYLTKPDFRDRCRRAEGDKYVEMVELVRDGAVSDGLGRMFARLCRKRGCLHQLHKE